MSANVEIDLSEYVEGTPAPARAKNPQLYPQSPLSGSKIEQDYKGSPDRLHNDRTPSLAVIHEKPEHRVAIMLKAQGMSNNDIAKRMGWTVPWTSQLLRQPWARQRLVDEISISGRSAIDELLRGEVENSIFKLIEVRDTAAKPADQAAAANALLDRFLGKPTQRVESKNETKVSYDSADVNELDRKIAEQERELARLTGEPTTVTVTSK